MIVKHFISIGLKLQIDNHQSDQITDNIICGCPVK